MTRGRIQRDIIAADELEGVHEARPDIDAGSPDGGQAVSGHAVDPRVVGRVACRMDVVGSGGGEGGGQGGGGDEKGTVEEAHRKGVGGKR